MALTDPQGALEALEAHPEEIGRAGVDLGNLLGRTLVERKLHAEATRLLRLSRGLKLVTDTAICLRLAKALAQKDESEEAMQALSSALAMDPACLPAMRSLHEMAARAGKPDEASQWLTRMLEADGSYPTAAYVYRERQKLPRRPGRAVRIALLSSYVLDWLVPYLDAECRRAGLDARVPRGAVQPVLPAGAECR